MQFKIENMEKLNEWKQNHKCEYTENTMRVGAIGGRLTYKFTPTGLGCIQKVRCSCGEEIDLTDLENW